MKYKKKDNKMINYKKAAMFGLDARIALVIFGTLSVISGAALYSAIQQSKVTSILVEMQEVSKAVEAFMLDTGRFPEAIASNTSVMDAHELVDGAGITDWKGPYLDYIKDPVSANQLDHNKYDEIMLNKVRDASWSAWTDAAMDCPKNYTGSCSLSIWFIDIKDLSLQKALETRIDGTVNPSDTYDYSGRFRYVKSTGRAVLLTIPYDKNQAK